MEKKAIVLALTSLAQDTRLDIFRLLVEAGQMGMSAGKISEKLAIAPSSLSFHLKELTLGNMVNHRQEGRYVIYTANFETMNQLMSYLLENCCGGEPCLPSSRSSCDNFEEFKMPNKVYNVLVLCTGNSARSILGEALFNELGKGKFKAYSAGSHPNGSVNPMAIELLNEMGLDTKELRSKSWDEFSQPNAPHFDFIFTVCDNAAGEVCPVWPGTPVTAHWGIADPAHVEPLEARRIAFRQAYTQLARRIQLFLALPIEKLDKLILKEKLMEIGKVVD